MAKMELPELGVGELEMSLNFPEGSPLIIKLEDGRVLHEVLRIANRRFITDPESIQGEDNNRTGTIHEVIALPLEGVDPLLFIDTYESGENPVIRDMLTQSIDDFYKKRAIPIEANCFNPAGLLIFNSEQAVGKGSEKVDATKVCILPYILARYLPATDENRIKVQEIFGLR